MTDEKVSDILKTILKDLKAQNYTLNELSEAFEERSFGLLLLLMALPNVLLLASVPGLSTLFGIILIFVSFQMIQQRQSLWLPQKLRPMTFAKDKLEAFLGVALPYIQKIERFCKARWLILTTPQAERGVGLICLINSILIALPLPFANFLCGFILLFIAMGMIMKDGVCLLIGILMSIGLFIFLVSTSAFIFDFIRKLIS